MLCLQLSCVHPMYALCFWVQISMVRVQRPMGNVNADEELAFGLMKDICRPRERDGITAIGLAVGNCPCYCLLLRMPWMSREYSMSLKKTCHLKPHGFPLNRRQRQCISTYESIAIALIIYFVKIGQPTLQFSVLPLSFNCPIRSYGVQYMEC